MNVNVKPLTAEEEAALRADVARRMSLWAVYETIGGGGDVLALARLIATLDAVRAASGTGAGESQS